MRIEALVVALALMPCTAMAQTVYKCEGADGVTVYAQQPCSTDASKVEERHVRGIGKADPAAVARQQATDDRSAMLRSEEDCVRQRSTPIYAASGARLRDYGRRIRGLEQKIATRANNIAGATWEAGMREEVAALHGSISTERASADGLVSDARLACQQERIRAEEAKEAADTD